MTSHAEYADLLGVNWSTLKHLETSQRHYQAALHALPTEPSDAMILGTVFHTLVLEPEKAHTSIAVWSGKTRSGKEWESFKRDNAGRTIIRAADYETACCMMQAVIMHPAARSLLSSLSTPDLKVEQPIRFEHRGYGCKSRLDAFSVERRFVLDLKSARSLDRRMWPAQVARMGYHGQLAFYEHAARSIADQPFDRIIIACESAEPYDVGVFSLDETARVVGDEMVERLFDRLDEYTASDVKRGRYSDEIEPLSLPYWAVDEDEPDIIIDHAG